MEGFPHYSSHCNSGSTNQLVQNLPVGLVIWQLTDLEDIHTFQLVAINPIACQILDLPVSTALETPPHLDPFPGFLKMEPPAVYAEVIRTHTPRDLGQIRYRHSLGSEQVYAVKAFPIPPRQVGVTFENITEHQQVETALRESERKLLFHLRQTPLAVIEWNLEFRVLEWNAAAEQIFGYSRREALGQPVTALVLPKGARDEIHQIWQRLIQFKTSISIAKQNVTGDGRSIICEWHNTPLIDEVGNVISVVSLVNDITHRKRTEAELRRFAAQLKQSNQALQEFAAVASHDLQEPLRKIQAFGDRLKTTCAESLSPEGQDYLQRMQHASQRMQSLIKGLLAFSRITTQAKPFIPVNLNELLREVLSDLEIRIQQANAVIEVGDLPTLDADPLQMSQLLQNLIGNALKFHRPNLPPHIQIQAEILTGLESSRFPAPVTPLQCQICVTDNGIGFDQKYLDRVFMLFHRLHDRTTYEGSGMGLAICRKIVERHNGQITAHSTPGVGSTFIVNLPMKQDNA
ncbi:MAG TPA: ATP-binding protein [Allocoleopsis sp.]